MTALINYRIEKELSILRKSRFFKEFDRVRFSLAFAKKIVDGEFSGGSEALKSLALCWCTRLLSYTDEIEIAKEYLRSAKKIRTGPENEIAQACIYSARGDKNKALRTLTGVNLPVSRSASFLIVAHHEGPQVAINWLSTAGLRTNDLSSDGKYFLLLFLLKLGNWEIAQECLTEIHNEDLYETPILYRFMAMTKLISTVPLELRPIALCQVPFEAKDFPLASDDSAMENRKLAQQYFHEASKVELYLNCPNVSAIDDEYTLWLKLRDPYERKEGMEKLNVEFSESQCPLHLVRLGLSFGINLHIDVIEREIERQIALNGEMTYDSANARFALALRQKTPKDCAEYLSLYIDKIVKYIDKKVILAAQIDLFTKAGMHWRVKECIDLYIKEGVCASEENYLRRKIVKAEKFFPVESR